MGSRFEGDAISRVLPATAPLMKLGVPYKDYWEIAPPGILFLLGAWAKLFGTSVFSFKVLQSSFLLGTGLLIFLVLKKIFSSFYALIVGSLAVVVLFSPYFGFLFLPIELFGLFFSLLGLTCLLYCKRIELRFFLSTFLLILASQMKDPFGPVILAIIPPLIFLLASGNYRSFLKACIFVISGALAVIICLGGYLQILGSLKAYFEVLNNKSQTFKDVWIWKNLGGFQRKFSYALWHGKNIIIFFQYHVSTIVWLWFFSSLFALLSPKKWPPLVLNHRKNSYMVVIPPLKLEVTSQTLNVLTVIFYSFGSFMGFTMGGKFDFHYLLQIVPPVYFFCAIIAKSILDNLQKILHNPRINFLLFPILILFLLPKGPYIKSYGLKDYNPSHVVKQLYQNITMPDASTEFEDYINSKTSKNSCILSIYGWSVGETYFYAKRRPCTRFFLPNLVGLESQKKEYRESILRDPPQAIVYTQMGADLDVDRFEQEIINFRQIIDSCYRLDLQYTNYSPWSRNLYFPLFVGEQLKTCIKQNAMI